MVCGPTQGQSRLCVGLFGIALLALVVDLVCECGSNEGGVSALANAFVPREATAATRESIKLRGRRALVSSAKVLDLAASGDSLFVATQGSGLFALRDSASVYSHYDVGTGLPSAVVLQVETAPDGRLFVGTERGFVIVNPASGNTEHPLTSDIVGERYANAAADLVVVSRTDGDAIVQLTVNDVMQEETAAATMWKLDRDGVRPWGRELGEGAEATAGVFDHSTDCLYVAGVKGRGTQLVPWLARECRGKAVTWVVPEGLPGKVAGIAAVARDPASGDSVLAVVTQDTPNPASRRNTLMRIAPNGKFEPYCPRAGGYAEEITGLVAQPQQKRLILARYGHGLQAVDCGTPQKAGDAGLQHVTALEIDSQGTLLVGTEAGAFTLTDVQAEQRAKLDLSEGIWTDALPWDVRDQGQTVLVSSAGGGVAELHRSRGSWRVRNRWLPRKELPVAVFGPAAYGTGDEVLLAIKSRGVLRVDSGHSEVLGLAEGLLSPHVLHLARSASGGNWVATGATPFDPGGGLQLLQNGKTTPLKLVTHPFKSVGDLLPWQDERVWAATRRGVMQVDRNGKVERLSKYSVTSLFRNEKTGTVAAVGSTVERWTPQGFVPVLFRIGSAAGFPMAAGHPVDVVIDDHGRWFLLYSSGMLVLLDQNRRFVGILGTDQGIPATSRKLLYLPDSGEVLIGTGREGLFAIDLH